MKESRSGIGENIHVTNRKTFILINSSSFFRFFFSLLLVFPFSFLFFPLLPAGEVTDVFFFFFLFFLKKKSNKIRKGKDIVTIRKEGGMK